MSPHTEEEWRPVDGWPHQVSNQGRVRRDPANPTKSGTRPATLAIDVTTKGYHRVVLFSGKRRKAVFVHRLVAEAWLGPRPEGYEVRHLNGDKTDNRPGNLCYGTPRQNTADAVAHGTRGYGSLAPKRKLQEDDVLTIRQAPRYRGHTRVLADQFGVSQAHISALRSGRRGMWPNVTKSMGYTFPPS